MTRISKTEIKRVNNTDTGLTKTVSKIKINEIKLKTIMCPAVIFANKRIIKEKGLVKIPMNSTTAKRGFTATGTPGIQKI